MNRRLTKTLIVLLALVAAVTPVAQTVGVKPGKVTKKKVLIEKIVLEGNERLTQKAFLALTSLRVGEPYDKARVIKAFHKIWESGLLDNLSIDSKPGKTGVILTFHIKERPILASIDYTGSKTLTSTTVLDKIKENKANIKSGTVLDYAKIKKLEAALRFMAAEKGYPDALVTSKLQSMGPAQVALTINVKQGPKARIEKVKFMGVHAFSQRKLRLTLKKTRSHWWLSWATRHDIYSESRYYKDVKKLRKLYESRGYLDVDIGDPIIDSHMNRKKTKKWLVLTIPITEGVSYKLGTISFKGNHVFTSDELHKMILLKKGKTLNKLAIDYVRKGIEARYGEKGYIYATATPIFDKHPGKKIANVTFLITEDHVYYVNRIEFYGNTSTRDYVLRREMEIYEQELFNYVKYKRGLYLLKQRAIFTIKKDPIITKVPNTNTVNIKIVGEEANKNELLFGGGYGGINGFFISGSFKTYNFMGMGTTLSLNAEVGKYQKLYSINYSDPWLFGKRIGGNFSVFNSQLDYLEFKQGSKGGSMGISFPLGDFAYWTVGYRYDRSDVTGISTNYISPDYEAYLNNSATSSVLLGIGFNTVNNPFRPMMGSSASLNATVAGGPVGGDNDFIKSTFDGSFYLPTFRKQNLAWRLSMGYITAYDGHPIPIWERFFLGGQSSLRGFAIRSIYPMTKDARYFLDPYTGTIEGGNRFYLLNNEYVFHLTEYVDVALFMDIGNTYHERQKMQLSNYRANAGVELRFFIPTFNVPLRLIYASNLKPRPNDDFSSFQISIGLTFQ